MTRLLVQKSGSAGFNLAISALLAGSVGFALFAMPQPLFEAIVEAFGLSNLISAAEPPLGGTARLAAVALGAALSFATAWMVLRLFDRPAHAELSEVEWDAPPRLRRADAHPDAPARRPLLAEQELGEPQDYPSPLQAKPLPVQTEDAQGGVGTDTLVNIEPAWPPQAFHTAPEAPEEPVVADGPPPLVDDADDALELGPELAVDEESGAEPLAEAAEEASPQPAPVETPVWPLHQPEADASNEALMARLALPEDRGGSISSLMQRLDTGLAKVEWPLSKNAEVPARPKDEVADELRSALDDLQRMAGGRG